LLFLGNNDNNNLNGNNNLNNNGRFVGIVKLKNRRDTHSHCKMQDRDLFAEICKYENLEQAFRKARKGKTRKDYIMEFEDKLDANLLCLRSELLLQTYRPRPLKTFILRDPKTRKISKSDFRDRVIHHALCNVIEPIFDKTFIHDSYANRKGKGTFAAIKRFDNFKRKVSQNNTRPCFVLKADIRHYFDNVDHNILIEIIKKRIPDVKVLWLIKTILENHKTTAEGTGMPLGNLTSQFFANVYLNELDQYVKRNLRARYYIRYVDDFVILHSSKEKLEQYKGQIDNFLRSRLALELHPDKSKIMSLEQGISFLGFRIFYHHRLVRKKNLLKFETKLRTLKEEYAKGLAEREKIVEFFEGWLAYVSHADTYKYRRHLVRIFNHNFPLDVSINIRHVKKHENLIKKTEAAKSEFTTQKTLLLFKKGHSISEIAKERSLKQTTVWAHLANLIEHNQISLWKVLPQSRVAQIIPHIRTEKDTLKEIKTRMTDQVVTFDEINCVLAHVKEQKRKRNICHLTKWYKQKHCRRKCPETNKRKSCALKLDHLASQNPSLEMTREEFLHLFNDHLTICDLPEEIKRKYIAWREYKTKTDRTKTNQQS
jgi:retron-type reverse transcriptase/predicted DNA-binding transcriptional regulator